MNEERTRRSLLAILLGIILLIVSLILYGPEGTAEIIDDMVDGTSEPTSAGGQPEVVSGNAYFVLFTDPVIPFDDVTTGGIDERIVNWINQAESTIDMAVFEFDLDSITDALIAAHERGVEVRVVYDDEHTEDDPNIEELIDAGIEAVPDERSAFMHNKFIVFDSQWVMTGSMNLTENGVYRNNNNLIMIRSTRLAENYTAEFNEMFRGEQFGPTSPADTPNPVVTVNDIRIENYFAPEDDVVGALTEVIGEAQNSIHFMAFAFTQDDIGGAMLDQLNDGVDVAGVFETRGANTEFSECGRLLDAGADVRLDNNPRTFHHKVIIIDESIVVIGSFNFSANATESNDENLLIIYDEEIAGLYEEEFQRQFARSDQVEGECLRDE